ncbi:MAG: diguanylate cyclase [Actinomycetota bacterium]|nr:diguanylate cyclase [Actinomycetota bacterium]
MAEQLALLRQRLQTTASISACAQLVCDHMVAMGYPLLSVYLCRSGRLRCFGATGYSQVLDGFGPLTGVIAGTVRSGEPRVVDVETSDEYLKAAASVVAEVCVPITVNGETVGALNIESRHRLGPEALVDATLAASMFAGRLADLGGVPVPTGWMYLADQAAQLVQIEEPNQLLDAALDVALQLSGADSGMVAVGNRHDGLRPVAGRGPLGDALLGLSPERLGEIGQWLDGPLACYSWGAPDGEWFVGFDHLRQAGLGMIVAVALVRGEEQLGYIVITDRRATTPSTELVEQLELLAGLVSSSLANARHMETLRDMARRDPLTGLGHQLAFSDRLLQMQQARSSFAVLAIDVDHFKSVNDTHGHEHGDRVLRGLAGAMSGAMRADDCLFRTGGDEFAAILVVSSEEEARMVAGRLEDAARTAGAPVSIGVAYQHSGRGADLFARADEALYQAKRAGRGVTVFAQSGASGSAG